ncbi:hypothetical protein A2773_01695 [Candidatus Gottesmanbacteria bacterium RIFCSPHIGHO2_01_FULL_39_10]|uniref:Uncharacterized protein n=1 Tax=Candidatus Gottesmanbacteria bacterium RIFCSPHIGHO2_01_FULL_39_10 TaxID=1798375 RepID=A0A1F5ZKL0_9BACT|nr:MAG: hypothetical protein A2773_01695 [Candidatus Gottesmanbacteria bacterium RIFCSPHIGHO2_01_FULL_39_10]
MTSGKSTKIKSSFIRFGIRTYFFDVNKSNERKYLKITEAKFMGEGKDRIYNSFLLFPDNVKDFQKNLSEAVSYLVN